jgi:hypothetical protein
VVSYFDDAKRNETDSRLTHTTTPASNAIPLPSDFHLFLFGTLKLKVFEKEEVPLILPEKWRTKSFATEYATGICDGGYAQILRVCLIFLFSALLFSPFISIFTTEYRVFKNIFR